MIQAPQVQRLRGDTHVQLDDVGASPLQRIHGEVERSLQCHGDVMMNVAQFRQGFARTVLRSSPKLGFLREFSDHRRDPKINGVIPEEERMDTENRRRPTRRGEATMVGRNGVASGGGRRRLRAAAARARTRGGEAGAAVLLCVFGCPQGIVYKGSGHVRP